VLHRAPANHPNLAALCRGHIEELRAALRDPEHRHVDFTLIRDLIEEVRLVPAEGGYPLNIFRARYAPDLVLPPRST
jgi:hypothetical protein